MALGSRERCYNYFITPFCVSTCVLRYAQLGFDYSRAVRQPTTVAHNCHVKYKLLTSNTNNSNQIQNPDIKCKLLTSNTNCSHQIQITHIKSTYSHQIQNPDIKYKLFTSNTNCSHQIQITHIKYKLLTSNTNYSYQIQNSDIKNKIKRSAVISHLTLICETLIL